MCVAVRQGCTEPRHPLLLQLWLCSTSPSTNQPPSDEMRAFTTARPSSVRHCTTCTGARGNGSAGATPKVYVSSPRPCCAANLHALPRACVRTGPALRRLTHLHQCARPVGGVDDQHSVVGVFIVDAHLQAQRDSTTALQAPAVPGASVDSTPRCRGPPARHTHWVGAGAAQAPHTPAGCRQRPLRHRLGSACAAAPGLGSGSGTAADHCYGGLPRCRTCAFLATASAAWTALLAVVLPMLLTAQPSNADLCLRVE